LPNPVLPAVVKGVKISINEFYVCLMFTNALQKGYATCGILRNIKTIQK
jgi:hypothetical protein